MPGPLTPPWQGIYWKHSGVMEGYFVLCDLKALGLTQEQILGRRHTIGGTDAAVISRGNPVEVNLLARQKRGLVEPENLNGVLPVMLGLWTEPFNLAWAERELGYELISRGERVHHPENKHWVVTLDAWDPVKSRPVNAKHTNARNNAEAVYSKYVAQMHWEMICTGSKEALLSVIYGNERWGLIKVTYDALYAGEIIDAVNEFWKAVQEGRDPFPIAVEKPVEPDEWIEIDLTGNNEYADAVSRIKENYLAHLEYVKAEANIKALCPDNAKRVFGYDYEVVRNKRGARTARPIGGK